MHDRYHVPDSERKHFAHTNCKVNAHVGKQVLKVFEKIPTTEDSPPKPPMLNIDRNKKLKDQFGSYI